MIRVLRIVASIPFWVLFLWLGAVHLWLDVGVLLSLVLLDFGRAFVLFVEAGLFGALALAASSVALEIMDQGLCL